MRSPSSSRGAGQVLAIIMSLAMVLSAFGMAGPRRVSAAPVEASGAVHMHGATPHIHGPQSYGASQLTAQEAAAVSTAPQVTRTGRVLVVQGDPRHDSGRPHITRYFLHEDNGAVSELTIDRATARQLGGWLNISGKRFEVSGAQLSGKKLAVRSLQLRSSAGRGDQASRTPSSTGTVRYATILCRYSDNADDPQPKSYFQGLMGGSFPQMDHYWRAQSYNQINIAGSANSVAGWYDLPGPRSEYGPANNPDLTKMFNDCTTAADENGYNFAGVSGVNMAFNEPLDADGAAYGGPEYLALDGPERMVGAVWIGSDHLTEQNFWAHEMGHAFGMPHSGVGYNNRWDSMSGGGDTCTVNAAAYKCVAPFTIMWHKDLPPVNNPLNSPLGSGWIPAGRKYNASRTGRQEVALGYADTTAGTDMLMVKIPISSGTGVERAYEVFYTVEARRQVSYDRALPGAGVLIHRVDTRLDEPARFVDANNNGNSNDPGSAWTAGKTFTDATNGIKIAVTAATPTGYALLLNGDDVADTTPPVAKAPAQNLTASTLPDNNSVYTQIAWPLATDTGGSGIAGYELQQRVNNTGDFVPVPQMIGQAKLSRAITLALRQGSYYQYRVRAFDGAGNASAWATGPMFRVVSYQDSGPVIRFTGAPSSTWATDSNTSYFGGTVKYTGDEDQAASLTFQGRNVAWVSTRYSQAGKAEVWLDGVRVGTYDLYSATDSLRRVVFSRAVTPGVNHTIQVRVLGLSNASSEGTLVDVDGFVTLK